MENAALQQAAGERTTHHTPVRETAGQTGPVLEVTPDIACLQLPIVNVYFFGRPHAADRSKTHRPLK